MSELTRGRAVRPPFPNLLGLRYPVGAVRSSRTGFPGLCRSYGWSPERFLDPATLLQALRFIADSRDRATAERLDDLNDAYRLFRCRGIMNCTEACPKGLNPARAIEQIKLRMLKAEL